MQVNDVPAFRAFGPAIRAAQRRWARDANALGALPCRVWQIQNGRLECACPGLFPRPQDGRFEAGRYR